MSGQFRRLDQRQAEPLMILVAAESFGPTFSWKKFWEGETAQLARRRQVRAKDPLAAATD